jgi:hypothetical protein
MTEQTKLTDQQLAVCMLEAEARKSDGTLPLDVRIRSFETYSICLREASNRGYDYAGMAALA